MNKLRLLGIGIVASAMTVGAIGAHAQHWDLAGNTVTNPTDILGATNLADVDLVVNSIVGLKLSSGFQIIANWPLQSNAGILNNGGLTNNGPLNNNGGIANFGPLNNFGPLTNNGPLTSNGGNISLNSIGSTQFFGNGGPFDINNNGGPMNIINNGGPIMLSNASGPVDIMSNFGPVNVNSNGGPLNLHSNGGPLDIASNGGPFTAVSNGGPLMLFANAGSLDLFSNANPLTLNSSGANIDLNSSGGQVNVNLGGGMMNVNGSGVVSGSWTVISDARFKKEINTLDNALAKVMQLRGVSYFYKADAAPQRNFPAGRQIGFIAQEVEQVVPELVLTSPEGYKSVAYQNITALLTEAVKTQQAQIRALQVQVARLEAALGSHAPAVAPATAPADGTETQPSDLH